MNEELEAIKKFVKASDKAIDIMNKLGGFFKMVFGDTAVELGGITHDWAKYYRYKNLVRIQDKVSELHQRSIAEGNTVPIPSRFAIPLLENASKEDDEKIQDLWAGLIANATNPSRKLNLKKIFIEILSSFEPLDVQIMIFFAKQTWNKFPDLPDGEITIKKLSEDLNVDQGKIAFSLQNLNRLGCLVAEIEPTWKDIGATSFGRIIKNDKATFNLSPLGFTLIEACTEK